MLQRLTLKDFKLFDESGITIEPGKITVLIGVNGSGKSSVLQALLLLKQSVKTEQIVPAGQFINVGSFKDITHGRDSSLVKMGLTATYQDFDCEEQIEPPIASEGTFDYDASFADNLLVSSKATIGGSDGKHLTVRKNYSSNYVDFDRIMVQGIARIDLSPTNQVGYPLDVAKVTPVKLTQDGTLEEQIKAAMQPHKVTSVTSLVNTLLSTVITLLQGFTLVPAIRGFQYLTYNIWQGDPPENLTEAQGPDHMATLVANIFSSDPDLAERVSDRLITVFQRSGRLRHRLDQGRLATELSDRGRSINLFNEAFGLSQLVIPLLALVKAPEGSLVGIEEPENHLHPRAQAGLCDVFVDIATHEDKQLILTTHSEHILMGLLTAVANGQLRPNDLAVYEFRREDDSARAERLEVNEYGQIAGGLKGFLEADLDEIGELIEARFR